MDSQLAVITHAISQLISQLQQERILDEQFQQLMMLQDESNPDFVVEVVQLYFEDAVQKVERMHTMLSASSPDFHELDQLVHQFKGSSSSLGAHAMTQLSISMREACQAQNREACQALHGQLHTAFETLKAKLQPFLELEAQRKALGGT